MLLTLRKKAGVTPRLKKCALLTNCIDYLGHDIKPGRLEVANHTTGAIRKRKVPTTDTELRSFLRLCNVFRWLVPGFARIASHLSKRVKTTQDKNLGPLNDQKLNALENFEEMLISLQILTLSKWEGQYRLDTDTCNSQVGCVLFQKQKDGKEPPIKYWSPTLRELEKNLETTHRECLAVVRAVILLWPYHEGTKFI